MANASRNPRARRAYEFIKAHRAEWPVETMCRVLDVAHSGYYEWLHKPISDRAVEDARLLALIRASYKASHGIYGAPRIFLDLREAGETCSKHRVERIMRVNKIVALHGILCKPRQAQCRRRCSESTSHKFRSMINGKHARNHVLTRDCVMA